MTVPAIVEDRLEGEDVTSRLPLGGDDELFVTPARTLIYRAEGLLSGESVDVYPHEAERVSVNQGRRKYTITLDHGLDGESQFSVPVDRFDQAIEPILYGVFSTAGITEPGETVEEVYRLGELTLVVTDARVVKHVGNALWDEEYEAYPFEAVTGIDIEEGSVSSQIIVEVDGRPQRIKIPHDDARRIQRTIRDGVLAFHDCATYEEFHRTVAAEREAVAEAVTAEPATESTPSPAEPEAAERAVEGDDDDGGEEDGEPSPSGMVFGEGVGTVPVEEADGEEDDVASELSALRSAVERQNDLLRRHQQTVERLVRELREQRDEG